MRRFLRLIGAAALAPALRGPVIRSTIPADSGDALLEERTCEIARRVCGSAALRVEEYRRVVPLERRKRLQALESFENWRNGLYLLADWLVVAGTVAATRFVGMHWIVYGVAVLVIGSRQRALMNLLHEASHNKLFKPSPANNWLGKLCTGFPLLFSLSGYVCAHCRHHGYLWNSVKDPKVARYRSLGLVVPDRRALSFFYRHVLRPLALGHVPYNVRAALSTRGERPRETVERACFWATVVGAVAALDLFVPFVLFWVVPYCSTFQVIRYWNEMGEHAGLQTEIPWLATRNWTSSLLVRLLFAPHRDDLYHLTHHLFPAIPHYRLPEAHRLLLAVPEYAAGHHCDGFFFPHRPDAPSVIQDIVRARGKRREDALATPAAAGGGA